MNGWRHTVTDSDSFVRLLTRLGDMPMPYNVKVMEGEARSRDQNSLLHMWFGEIAKQKGMTIREVKGLCHRELGLPIRLRDEVFAWVWERSGAHLPYEKQCALLASGALRLSSGMLSPDFREYLNEMQSYWRGEGVFLTDPEARKYEETA